ncbi:MAG: hypothetical protein NW701_09810 [Nitrospira sp.]
MTLPFDFGTMRSNSELVLPMKTVLFRSSVSLLLLVVLIMLGGAMTASVAHDVQHAAHHTAASHSHGICAWMCAAGGIAQQSSPSPEYVWSESDLPASVAGGYLSAHLVASLTSRAPPVSIT